MGRGSGTIDALYQHLQPRGRGVLFGLGAVLPHSNTPALRVAGFEDEDDDEYEGFCGGASWDQRLGGCFGVGRSKVDNGQGAADIVGTFRSLALPK